jgi:hypothetical protein
VTGDPARQLDAFIAKYSDEVAATARDVLPRMRAWFPGSHELVYDNYNALAIAWSPTGKTSDVICSIALYPRWVSLFFMRGANLADPAGILKGDGSTIRHVVLEHGLSTLDTPAVIALIAGAVALAPALPTTGAAPTIVIRSVSAKQRPRRPAD